MFIAVLSTKLIFLFLLLPRARPLFIMHVDYNSSRTPNRLTPGNTLIYKPSLGRKRTLEPSWRASVNLTVLELLTPAMLQPSLQGRPNQLRALGDEAKDSPFTKEWMARAISTRRMSCIST